MIEGDADTPSPDERNTSDPVARFAQSCLAARGLCLTLQAGPSWLWTVPDPALAVQTHRLGAAFVGGAELSWPIWRGRTGVIPGVGARSFAIERGVRLDHIERFALGGLAPRIALAFVQRID